MKEIILIITYIIIGFILLCNFMGGFMGFLTDCGSDRKIANNYITGFGYQMTCSNQFK